MGQAGPQIRPWRFSHSIAGRFPPLGRFGVGTPRLHYVEAGPRDAPPVVLIHGASGNLRDWHLSILPDLARRHRVIAIDRPGFGHSEPLPRQGWQLSRQAAVMRRLVAEELGHQRYVLAGHSYGGALVLRWAIEHPDEVAGVLALGAVAMDWGGGGVGLHYQIGGRPVLGDLMARLAPVLGPRQIDETLDCIFAPNPVPETYRQAAGVEFALRPRTFRANARMMLKLYGQIREQAPHYGRIVCPVEIVHGADDPLVPASIHVRPLAERLARPRVTLLPGVGHMPHHVAPVPVVEAIGRLTDQHADQ